jgi:hypothetical protein
MPGGRVVSPLVLAPEGVDALFLWSGISWKGWWASCSVKFRADPTLPARGNGQRPGPEVGKR